MVRSFGRMLAVALTASVLAGGAAHAQQCSNDGARFEAWKQEFRQVAAANGVGERGLSALANTRYSTQTISADRNQRSFRLSLDEFMQRRGATQIVQRGKRLKREHAALFQRIEQQYGVPAGPLLAKWGMETAFGGFLGDHNIVSAIVTLTYDCRRSDFFRPHAIAALELVDRGWLSPTALGAAHGEIGQTQFLPANVIRFGVDGDGDGRIDLINSRADALASTANFLRNYGWRPGAGYQQGEPNFAAIQAWNAAGVYQQAIAIIARQIDAD